MAPPTCPVPASAAAQAGAVPRSNPVRRGDGGAAGANAETAAGPIAGRDPLPGRATLTTERQIALMPIRPYSSAVWTTDSTFWRARHDPVGHIRLLAYHTPRVRYGDAVTCTIRVPVEIVGLFNGRIPWPTALT